MPSGVAEGLQNVTTIGTTVIDFIIGNPIGMIFLAASLFGIGVGVFRRLKGR